MSEKNEENENSSNKSINLKNKRSLQEEEEINDFVIGGRIALNDYKMNLSSKFMINKDPETKALISNSITSFSHKVSSWMEYSLTQNKNNLKFCTSMSPINNFLLTTDFTLKNTDKISSFPINFLTKYTFKNNSSIQIGIKNYDIKNLNNLPLISPGLSFNFWGNKIFTGCLVDYCLKEKFFKSSKIEVKMSNKFLKSLIDFNFDKKNKSSNYEKLVKFNGEINVTNNLSLGTEVEYNTKDKKGTKLKLFSNFIIDQFTNFVSEWNDKDKSITLNMEHDFRGLAKLRIKGKFTPSETEKIISKVPSFKSKIGLSVDIFEPLL